MVAPARPPAHRRVRRNELWVLLVFGLATPLGAGAVIGSMVAAVVTVHWRNGFFVTKGGYELNLALAAGALAVAFAGPGSISADAALGWKLAGITWGISAALGGATAIACSPPRTRARSRSTRWGGRCLACREQVA